jgi:pilus assembly protein CpaC
MSLVAGFTSANVMAQGKTLTAKVGELPNQQPAFAIPAAIGPTMTLVSGKSTLLRLDEPIDRVSVGNPAVADVTLISSRELYLLGKTFGSTNMILWRKGGQTTVIDLVINIDAGLLKDKLTLLMPTEKDITVNAAADSVVLSGVVSSAPQVQNAVQIADAFVRNINKGLVLPIVAGDGTAKAGTSITVGQAATGGATGVAVATAGARVINLLRVAAPQQVMLEVKVAEVSRTLLDKLGTQFNWTRTDGSWIYSILTGFLTNSAGVGSITKANGNGLTFDAAKQDGLIKILAEPTIVAISGQEGSFLAGGKIFIPTASTNQLGFATITLTEKEFGVGLKFTPTVLDAGLIHLRVARKSPSCPNRSPFTTVNGITSVLPSFTTRRAETSVQLYDGQSFAIAGLIKNNVTETVKRFPLLGELPYIGALSARASSRATRPN